MADVHAELVDPQRDAAVVRRIAEGVVLAAARESLARDGASLPAPLASLVA